MGFFGGKKKDKEREADAGADQQASQRKSRRIVAPGAKGNPPAAAPGKNETRSAQVRPGAPRPQSKPLPGTDSGRMQEPRSAPVAAPPRQAQPTPLPQGDSEIPNLISSPPRPKSREPIIVGQSRPPEFAGGLNQASRREGPCRTGDEALLDFLQNKANLLSDEQVASVRAKADGDSLPIDIAAVQLGFITEEQMVNALTQECWVPHLKVDKYEIRKKALDTVAREDAMHFGVFPVDKLGSLLTLAMVNPLDAETIRVLENKTSLDIKKVVATRTEITQGIEKYYSGQVQAKDGSLGFSQDVEPKSVTQMMSKVAPAPTPAPTPPSRPLAAMPAPPPADNIVPEIQDIDDLLSSDEAIAPAIIEPISLKADAEIVPVEPSLSEPEPVMQMEAIEPEPILAPPPAGKSAHTAEFTMDDASSAPEISEPVLTRKPAPQAPAPKAPALAPEFELEDAPITAPPRAAPPQPAPAPRPPVAPARAQEPALRPPTAAIARQPDAGRPATSRFTGTGRTEKSGVVNLIPVMEEEFQHAITHGKSHVFEKWVGLQSRNRIINAQAVESDFDRILGGLYENKRRL